MTSTRHTALESLEGTSRSNQVAGSVGERVFAVNEHGDESDVPVAGVRVTHLAPDAPAVDVAVDGESVVSGIAFERTTPYFVVEPGTHDVTITATGDEETVLYDESIAVEMAFYTVAVLDAPEEAARVELLSDAGSALLRLVHAAPDAPAVDVRDAESGRAVFGGVGFGRGTNYIALPSGSYTLEVAPAATGEETSADGETPGTGGEDRTDRGEDAVATVTVELEANTAYTAFAEGFLEPGTDTGRPDRAFAVQLTEDGPAALEESDAEPEQEPDSGERAPGDDDSDGGDDADEAGMDDTDGDESNGTNSIDETNSTDGTNSTSESDS
ncbi:DUF4397 domain-containing protein [Natronosalvus caseinilyticus]|uniref:DUF4397 domain-containing protein n=1 Tax=Natronosalvus caseinilyticus TaxID=2953747 RepID=UPI0028ACEABC|nr:DUF4397 domain-containing protein [Natronosalvus caseinilyticus]